MTRIQVPPEAVTATLNDLADELERYANALPGQTTPVYPEMWLVYCFQRASQLEKKGLSGINGGRLQLSVIWRECPLPQFQPDAIWEHVECWGLTKAAFDRLYDEIAEDSRFEELILTEDWYEPGEGQTLRQCPGIPGSPPGGE